MSGVSQNASGGYKYFSKGFAKLKAAFVDSFSGVEYSQVKARHRLLQMPSACTWIDFGPGQSECVLIEYHHGINYKNLSKLLQNVVPKSSLAAVDKTLIHSLLGLCQSDREREYAVFKASGLSATQARKQLGFESMSQRTRKVEDVITHVEYIQMRSWL